MYHIITFHEAGGIQYGIAGHGAQTGGITKNRDSAERLSMLCNVHHLDPIHLEDVAHDWFLFEIPD